MCDSFSDLISRVRVLEHRVFDVCARDHFQTPSEHRLLLSRLIARTDMKRRFMRNVQSEVSTHLIKRKYAVDDELVYT